MAKIRCLVVRGFLTLSVSLFLLGLSPLPGDEAEGEEEAEEGRRQAEEDREGHDAQDDDEKNAEID